MTHDDPSGFKKAISAPSPSGSRVVTLQWTETIRGTSYMILSTISQSVRNTACSGRSNRLVTKGRYTTLVFRSPRAICSGHEDFFFL